MIHISETQVGGDELRNLKECIDTNWISSQGPFVKKFEEAFAKWNGSRYGVATTSGTTALHLAVAALGLEEGDEVLVPVLTFIATANIVRYCNGIPIFLDSNFKYWNINPGSIEEKITPHTKGIIPVHLYGYPCDMESIMEIAKAHKLWVVEDCAEAHGAKVAGKKVGSLGDIGCFSFYANKIITTGEGGMCLTDDKDLYEKMVLLRDHGMDKTKKYWYNEVGFNYRMTNLQAAVGLAQLENIDLFIDKRNYIKRTYSNLLPSICRGQIPMPWAKDVCWLYTTLVEDRDSLMAFLKTKEIETRPMFYPITQMPPYKSDEKFPVAEYLSKKGMNLPTYPGLGYKKVKYIVDCIKEFYGAK